MWTDRLAQILVGLTGGRPQGSHCTASDNSSVSPVGRSHGNENGLRRRAGGAGADVRAGGEVARGGACGTSHTA